jgi:hypothetical protein
MVVLLYGVEVEILNELAAPDREKFLREAAGAYRARAECLKAAGKPARADLDVARAAKLETNAAQLAAKGQGSPAGAKEKVKERAGAAQRQAAKPAASGRIRMVNEWEQPVTVVVGGVPYLLRAGEQKTIARPVGTFSYEVLIPHHWSRGRLEAGRVYTIRVHSR